MPKRRSGEEGTRDFCPSALEPCPVSTLQDKAGARIGGEWTRLGTMQVQMERTDLGDDRVQNWSITLLINAWENRSWPAGPGRTRNQQTKLLMRCTNLGVNPSLRP
jgi:hypothetical protein